MMKHDSDAIHLVTSHAIIWIAPTNAEKAGLTLNDLEPEFGAPKVLIFEASDETPG